MISSGKIKIYLYWLLVLQVCFISISIAVSSMLLSVIIVCIIILFSIEKKWILPHTAIDIAFFAYCVIEFVTSINSAQQFDAFKNSKRFLLILIVYSVIISFDTKEKVIKAVQYLSGTVALLSIVEIIFYLLQSEERLYLFQHYMTTGGLKMIVSLMVLPFVLSADTGKKERLFFLAAFVPTLIALVLTNTRSAWLGLVFGVIVMSALYYRKLFVLLVIAIILFFQFAPTHQTDRAKSIVDISNSTNVGRFNMWSTGIRMWKDKPILGFGDIDLYKTYLTYRTPTGDEPAGHLHNNYVHLLVTIGAAGLIIVLFLFFVILKTEYKIFSTNTSDQLIRNISLGAISVFSGFMVNGIFEWNFGDHEIMVFVWFTVGLCLAVEKVAGKKL